MRRSRTQPGTGRLVRLAAVALLGLLAACAQPPAPAPEDKAPQPPGRSDESVRIERYYRAVEQRLAAAGMMRTDGGGPDTPFSPDRLVADFERIALYDEYVVQGGRFVARQTPAYLRRWEGPIRYRIVAGELSTPEQVATFRREVADYARRLSRLTGLSIREAGGAAANMIILYLYRDEQRAFARLLPQMLPGIGREVVNEIANSPRDTFCAAYALSSRDQPAVYSAAVILIKAEHGDLGRLSCIHEEMAQSLGLANDSPTVRPSIFNDDEEFALLTHHDELLLRMLYDRRLRPGMTPDQARPILRQIAQELMGTG